MEIFNVILGDADAKEFCKQTEAFKIDWIKRNTNQQSDMLIKEFLSNPKSGKKCNCGCGGKKETVVAEKVIAEKTTTKKKID